VFKENMNLCHWCHHFWKYDPKADFYDRP
jgi:hypothetical protein